MSETIQEIFTKNLHYLMDKNNISQIDISRALNVSTSTVSDWCNGNKFPRVDRLQRIAELLGVRPSALTTETGLQDYEDQLRLEALHQDPRLGILFDHTRKMKKEDVDFMIQMAERMIKERDGE